MNQSRLVDLLLVRLSREEEKKKVEELLISELGMSIEEARDNVENSPSILSEGVEMEQARILQDRMYPFVDLLPRQYGDNAVNPDVQESGSEESSYELITDNIPVVEDKEDELHPDTEDSGEIYHDQSSVKDDDYPRKHFNDDDDDSLIITSAAEEMLSVERCHICGRTPTNGQKLVPCRTCEELTCSDCFNRKYHVCEKCASEGRVVDKPLDSAPHPTEQKKKVKHTETKKVSPKTKARTTKPGLFSKISPLLIVIIALVLVIAAFTIIDPLNLFVSSNNSIDEIETVYADTAVIHEPDTVLSDSVAVADTTLSVDTTITSEDSLLTDSLIVNGYISLRDISIPDSLGTPEEYSLPLMLTSSPVSNIEIQIDSLQLLVEPMGKLAAIYSIKFDAFSLVSTDDGFDILIMSILHPEPAEKRTALIGKLGMLLDSTMVDQMVLYYRENQYYETNIFSFTADSFSILSGSSSPYFLQRKQAIIPETAELVTGRIFDWMTDLN
ncbi:MAG: hypothetical protein K8S15_09445 [Candidatus Aegiribacteria sp.]|nr:hypothetical protein [Candidatus Aegiribacteria sp.]